MLATSRKVAVAEAKVRAIELAMEEQEIEERRESPGIPHVKTKDRTLNWVCSNPNSVAQSSPKELAIPNVKDEGGELNRAHTKLVSETPPHKKEFSQQNSPTSKFPEILNTAQHMSSQSFVASTPIREMSDSHLIEMLTLSNKQMIAGLARQNLPKCQPDTFSGDPTFFHP